MMDDSTDHEATAFNLTNPVSAIVGTWPDTRPQNFKTISEDAELIRARNDARTPAIANDILAAMDRCFGDKTVKHYQATSDNSVWATR